MALSQGQLSSLATGQAPITKATSITDWAQNNYPPAPDQKSTTWYRANTISWQNWNQFYPIQLMVVEKNNGVYAQKTGGNWQFIFPVGLEGLSIDMPFAAANTITLGGDITEWNGAPVRNIQISGTFGAFPGRGNGPITPATSFVNSVFAGTINNLTNTITSAQNITNLGNPPKFQTNVVSTQAFEDVKQSALLTGYAQKRLLATFFESFNELMKTKAGANCRLAIALWKQEAVYLVTPIDYQETQSANSPLEENFSISFKATKRIKLSGSSAGAIQPYVPVTSSPDKMARLLNTIQQARTTLQGAQKTIQAIGGDIEASLFTPLRELTLVAKDALSIPFAACDMANNVINSMKDSILQLASTKNAITNFKSNIKRAYGTVTKNAATISSNMTSLAAEQVDAAFIVPGKDAAPANDPFLDPVANYDFFSGISIGDLNLPPTVLSAVATERQRIRSLTRLDFQNKMEGIQQVINNYANHVGLGGSTYNSVYGITPPANTIAAQPTDDDYEVLFALNSVLIEISRLVVSTTDNTNTKQDTIATVAGMANASGIAFQIPTSKFPIPFPYGATIESLAAKYLGSPDRAIEIITLNGLRSPYVDEVGFELPLLANGVSNVLFVTPSDNLFVGQPVWVSSTTVNRIQTRITGLRNLASDQLMVTVADDVSAYTTQAKATLLAYLPGTVNSQQTIYIPSQEQAQSNDLTLRNVPGINQYDPLLAVGGIDLLLTQDGDLVIDKSGDTKFAVGLTNLVQFARLALQTPRGALNRHPEYGLDLQPGVSLADLSATEIVQSVQSMFNNSAFSGVNSAKVSINGPIADLNIGLTIAPTSQILPLNVQINK